MSPRFNSKMAGVLLLAGLMEISLVAGQDRGYFAQVIMTPSTITQAVTLAIGSPASEITFSVVRTGMVTADIQDAGSSTTSPPPSIVQTVFVSDGNNAGTVLSDNLLNQPFSLPTQQAVVTQAPCVSACLQEGLIASAVGACGLTPATVIDNACACLSAPLIALHALTNCASAACTGIAAGSSGLDLDLVAVTNLYNEYCTTAVGAAALASAVSSGQAVQATAAADPSTVTVTASSSPDTAAATTVTASPSDTSATTIGNGTLTSMNGNMTAGMNATLGDGDNPTALATFTDTGVTAGVMSTTTAAGATATGTKSQAALELPRKSER
jgi:hypothetical protein